MRAFCSIGINDMPGFSYTKEYKTWSAMLNRCHGEKSKKAFPAYIDCYVSDEFLRLSEFYKWCQNQIGFEMGFDIDKDLLERGNREYHPDKCVFIPRAINNLLKEKKKKKSGLPCGVTAIEGGKFAACIGRKGKIRYLGSYDEIVDAEKAYNREKEVAIKEEANKYKDMIDPRAYEALMNYKVEITD